MPYIKNNNYEFYNGKEKLFETEEISFLYDLDTFTLLQHGKPVQVTEYWQHVKSRNKDLAKSMAILTGRFDIEDVNKILSTTGYIEIFLEKLRKLVNECK